jgi:hypothetical protein
MDKILAKYVYKDYRALLIDRDFQFYVAKQGWIAPAVIPHTPVLRGNRLIRKYLTYHLAIKQLLRNGEFQRILCNAGYYGPACTTSSTTTTSTTT